MHVRLIAPSARRLARRLASDDIDLLDKVLTLISHSPYSDAACLLESCNWDIERALTIYRLAMEQRGITLPSMRHVYRQLYAHGLQPLRESFNVSDGPIVVPITRSDPVHD
jgi:hypothetical protein